MFFELGVVEKFKVPPEVSQSVCRLFQWSNSNKVLKGAFGKGGKSYHVLRCDCVN